MNKKIFIIGSLIFIVLITIISVIFFIGSKPNTKSSTQKIKTNTSLPAGAGENILPADKNKQTVLFLFPNPISFSKPINSATESAKVYVQIDTQQNKIANVQIELSYDPTAVSLISVEPNAAKDAFFQNPSVVLSLNDSQNGTLLYSLENTTGAQSGQGTVATITFVKNPQASSSAPLRFLGKTTATGPNSPTSLLKLTLGGTFLFENSQ